MLLPTAPPHLHHRRNWGVVTALVTKPEDSTRPEQNAGPERRLNLKNPRSLSETISMLEV